MLYSHREETATSGPVVSISLQWPAGPSQQPVQHNWPACTLLVLKQKDAVPSPQGDVAVGLARCHMTHILKQNKGTDVESETGKDNPTQGEKFRTSCEGSLFQ